jgi:prophage antirepressor-like protein
MTIQNKTQLFEQRQVRTVWDDGQEKWYVSIIDVVGVLTDQSDYQGARSYWKVLKHRSVKEGNETVTICNRLKLAAPDGKMRLTDIIYKTWSDHMAKEYKRLKGLKKENLRDHTTNRELVLSMLAELSTKDISEAVNPETLNQHSEVARRGGNVARKARLQLETETGQKVVTPLNAKSK